MPKKMVVTVHDCVYRHFPKYLGRWWWRKWMAVAAERFAARADLVLTDSHFSAEDLSRSAGIPREKIRVLYPWVGPEFHAQVTANATAELRARYRLPEKFWLYLGGFDYRKNVERLIEAYSVAAKEVECLPLVLAGAIPRKITPPYSNIRGAIQRFGLSASQVLLPGCIASDELPALYTAASLFIYPSLCEGFGLPPAEAIVTGTPVIVAANSSLPEVVRRRECHFDGTSIAGMVTKLTLAASAPNDFRCPLPADFTERTAIPRYLALLKTVKDKHPFES